MGASSLRTHRPERYAGERVAPRRRRGPRGRSRFAFAAPGIAVLAVFSIYPIYLLLKMSVSEVSTGTLNQAWPFVGLQNYASLFQGPSVAPAALDTALFVAIVTLIGIIGGLGVAMVLERFLGLDGAPTTPPGLYFPYQVLDPAAYLARLGRTGGEILKLDLL